MGKRKLLIFAISLLLIFLSFSCSKYHLVNIEDISFDDDKLIFLIDCGNSRLKDPIYINVSLIDSKKMLSNDKELKVERNWKKMKIFMPIDLKEIKTNEEIEIYISFGAVTILTYVIAENEDGIISFNIMRQELSHRF